MLYGGEQMTWNVGKGREPCTEYERFELYSLLSQACLWLKFKMKRATNERETRACFGVFGYHAGPRSAPHNIEIVSWPQCNYSRYGRGRVVCATMMVSRMGVLVLHIGQAALLPSHDLSSAIFGFINSHGDNAINVGILWPGVHLSQVEQVS